MFEPSAQANDTRRVGPEQTSVDEFMSTYPFVFIVEEEVINCIFNVLSVGARGAGGVGG